MNTARADTAKTGRQTNQHLESAVAEAEQRYVAGNPASAKQNENARATMPGGNTRTTLHYGPFPLAIRSAKGSKVTDVDGHSYVDFINEHTAASSDIPSRRSRQR